jgi:hypothetical protein
MKLERLTHAGILSAGLSLSLGGKNNPRFARGGGMCGNELTEFENESSWWQP